MSIESRQFHRMTVSIRLDQSSQLVSGKGDHFGA
jgi:hypothetical protein